MKWNPHYEVREEHAFLSPSKYHWLNYDLQKLKTTFDNFKMSELGTRLHAFASECIELNQSLPKSKKTLNLFVNDAIGFRMQSEQILYFSNNCFGTADAICFRNNELRIHDLKTGVSPASMHQLEIYAALFCLEYQVDPKDIFIELRLYQTNEVVVHNPEAQDIREIMNKIIFLDKELEKIKREADD